MKALRFIFVLCLLPAIAHADCQLAIVDPFAASAERLKIVGASGRLSRSIAVSGKPQRIVVAPNSNPLLYMTEIEPARITSVRLDGSGYSTLVDRALTPLDIAIHNGSLYWSEDTADPTDQGQGAIIRSELDGSNPQQLVGGLTNPDGIAFGANGKLYWTSAVLTPEGHYNTGEVYSADLDGSNAERILDLTALAATSVPGGRSRPIDVFVDDIRSQLLVVDLSSETETVPGRIWRADLDGANASEFGRFGGCSGSAICSPKLTSNLDYNSFLNVVALSDRDNKGGTIRKYNAETGATVTTPIITVTGSGITFLGTEQGLCSPSGNLIGSDHRNFSVWRPVLGTWFERENSLNSIMSVQQWGLPGDIPLLANFNGDSFADLVVWRPFEGRWYLCDWDGAGNCKSTEVQQWGLPGDIPIIADFNGDSLNEIVIWRPSEGNWYNKFDGLLIRQWGLPNDLPLSGDFNSDGRDDFVVWRQSNGTWYVLHSSFTGQQPDDSVTFVRQWGLPGDHPLLDDYDGDDKPDLAVWRPSTGVWFICTSSSNYNCPAQFIAQQFGLPGDIPVTGDFDGDGKADLAVWRPNEGNWYYFASASQQVVVQQWGLPGDIPLGRSALQLSLEQ